MIRTTRWPGVLAAVLFALTCADRQAAAQTDAGAAAAPHGSLSASGEVLDVPAGPAAIRGRVVHRARPEAAGGVTVALFALSADGRAGARRAQTGPNGQFAFENVSNDPGTVYLVAVQFAEISYGARVVFDAGQLEQTAVIEVSDTRADGSDLAVGAVSLRVDRGCNGLRITETHEVRNPTDFVLRVPPRERAMRPPIFRTPLPASATFFAPGGGASEDALQLVGEEVLFWGPLHRGSEAIEFSYAIPDREDAVVIERRFPLGAEKVAVLTSVDAPRARGEGLRPAGEVRVGGVPYAAVASGALAPGQGIAFSLDLGAVAPSAEGLSLREVEMLLELDDAALDVREELEIAVSGDAPLRSDSDAPLLCMPLPEGAEGLRFSSDAFALGVEPDASGGLALRGPIPAGTSSFVVSYLLRSGSDRVRFARSFPTNVSLLTLRIADTGLITRTDRLHRRRPIRTRDRTYVHLEAFEIEPGEIVALDLESLPSQPPLPRLATLGFVATAAVLAIAFLIAPLRSPRRIGAAVEAAPSTEGEREAVYAAIHDLEDDFETGKISAEDRALMLEELRKRAGALLLEERRQQQIRQSAASGAAAAGTPAELASEPASPQSPTRPAACPRCGGTPAGDARFCSRCGASLTPPTAAGDREE